MPAVRNNPVSFARAKAKKVQSDMAVAEAELHDSNAVLANAAVGPVPTTESVDAAVKQNVNVEEKLHAAVQELDVVNELLKVADAKNAEHDKQAVAGRRSGEGLASVIDQMRAAETGKARLELGNADPLAPASAGKGGIPPTPK